MSFSNGNLYNLTTSGKKIKKERRADGNNKDERKPGHKDMSHSFRPSESIEHNMDRCNRCG
ncbi:MAG: hypothetical protein V3T40_05795 [Nitrososphaerales archaeon]